MRRLLINKLLFALLLFSCENKEPIIKYEKGRFPEYPVNFEQINSEFDDYNSNLNVIYYDFLLSFSSNRYTQGNTFDFVGISVRLVWSQTNGTFTFELDTNTYWFTNIALMIDSANSSFNEFGPYAFGYSYPDNCFIDLLLYSSDIQGNFDIYYSYSKSCTNYDNSPYFSHSNKLGFINSLANEQYPSFYGENFYFHNEWGNNPDNIVKMIYCSDINGQYDIFEVDFISEPDIINTLSTSTDKVSDLLNINSSQDDNCPFINGKLLVFASNRDGGFGGYDLYYSQLKDGVWLAPVNFGDSINTKFDEFRPITLLLHGFENNLMIFSSNRKEGKGGFDLYYVGIKQMIE